MKLILNNFGKFQNISFDLTDLTVFFGSNESGKTTLHDAFFDILCNPPASNKAGKHLRERYGRKRSAKLNGLKNELSIDQYEFRALRSIRGEDLYFIPDDEKEKSWLERLQNRLFHGGLNPGDIIESLERNYIPKPGNRKVTREFNECEDNIRSEKEQLNNIIAEKDALHKERKEMEKKEKQFTKIDLEAGQLKKKIKQIESKLDFYEKLDERKRLLDRLQLISDLEQARKKLAAFASFSAEELKQFNKFTELRIHQEKELSSIEAETKLLQESLDRKKQNVEKLKQKVEVDSSLDGFANAMLDRILEFRKSTAHKIVTSWNFRFIAIPFAIFFASFFAFFLSDTFIRWTVFLACGSFAVLLFFLLCRKKVSRLDKNTHDEFLARLHDDWNTRIKEKIDLKTLEGFEREILTFRAHHSDNLRTLNSDKSDFSQQEERLHSLKRQELDIRQNLAEKDSAINEILTRNNIANRDQYLTGYAEKIHLEKQIDKLEIILNKEANGNNDLFRIECERKLRILDEEGITDDHSGSADRTFLIAQKKQLEEDLLSCEKDVREFTENKSKFYGRFNERQKRFIEQINTIQNNIFLYQSNMAELEFNRKSAECALKIFNKLQISANTEMDLIITEIKKRLDTIFPDGRILELESLEHDKIYLTDMGSTKRQINHLSKGTRDCFAFAAKLAFLARTPNDTKMLFLDEPFLSMDQTRMESAVRLLKNHQKETENRIIVFTKDNSLVKALKKTFQNATIHELTT